VTDRARRAGLACATLLSAVAAASGCGGSEQAAPPDVTQGTAPGLTAAPTATGAVEPRALTPPPGEQVLLFASDRDGDYELFRMDVDGSGQEQVTLNTSDDREPDASMATGWIAWSSEDGIEILAAGSDRYALSNVWRQGAGFYEPAWSPDGARIAFVAGDEGISVAAADGSGERLVAEGSGFSPTWSPDGRALAFFERGSGFSRVLRVLALDGSGGRDLAQIGAGVFVTTSADWSPDGAWIAYDCFPEEVDYDAEICVVAASGGKPVNLTRSRGDDYGAEWSPDGSMLAFTSVRDGDAEIYVMNADGSGQVRLTGDPAWDTDPAWAVDAGGELRTYAVDSFDDPASGWERFSGETSSAGYEEGSLIVRAGEPGWLATSAAPESISARAAIRLDVRDTGAASDAGFGFVCAYRDLDNHFAAGIGSDGTYAILERLNGETTILTGDGSWTRSEAIEPGAASYRIEGECREHRIVLQVDGLYVDSVTLDDGLPEDGTFGVFLETFAEGGAEVRFDEVAYSGLPRTVLPSLTQAP
jgi:TolB protein